MTEILGPLAAALAVFCVMAGGLRMLWQPALDFMRHYNEASPYHDALESVVIAGGGGRKPAFADDSWRTGLSNAIHDQLNLTEAGYMRGLQVAGGFVGTIVFVMLSVAMSPMAAAFLGVFVGILFYFAFDVILKDKLREIHGDQVRKFPFFLDIFLLTVQAGGDMGDAIAMYRRIYGNDAIGRELAILQESYRVFDEADSFDRLRNRVGHVDLKNVIGELAQKIRVGDNLQKTLEQQSEDMRQLREELGAKAAERLNAKFSFPVILAAVATLLIFLSPAIAIIMNSGFL